MHWKIMESDKINYILKIDNDVLLDTKEDESLIMILLR